MENRLRGAILEHLRRAYDLTPDLVVEIPPRAELGDFATPVCFELARKLRQAPRKLAQEIAAGMGASLPEGFARVEAAGAGYLNFFLDRAAAMRALAAGSEPRAPHGPKVIVEHTNINPNKAAHIGHLRNAVLGDTWVRLLRARGEAVEVQNLQDNTGVQVADVVAAFLYLNEQPGDVARARARVEAAIRAEAGTKATRFDYLCWDLYAAISQRYESDPEALAQWRPAVLHAIEAGGNAIAELATAISDEIARCHLRTMERLGIRYDVLPRESEILQMHLWEHAFRLLKERGAVRLEPSGKNAGCWVMDKVGQPGPEGEEDSKVIVRSNGTVTYVAKDIAYQLWKFGLLPLDFGYAKFFAYPGGGVAWRTALPEEAAADAPQFGRGAWVYNVIDTRQSYLQDIVANGLRALGFEEAAERSIHFSYEMVALSAACAAELGYAVAGEEKRVDVSGRKGTGVKADDLIDRLMQRTREEVASRHPEESAAAVAEAAERIALGALRYFLLKFTRTTVIAFDFKEALNFEGETGPYVQYAALRAAKIRSKAGAEGAAAGFEAAWARWLEDGETWNLLWLAARLEGAHEQAIAAREPAFLAKYAFQLAQAFNAFYHHQPVLQAPDAAQRAFLLWVVGMIERQLTEALALMGIAVPAVM